MTGSPGTGVAADSAGAPEPLLLTGAVIDVAGTVADVLVHGERIARVGDVDTTASEAARNGCRVVDLAGHVLLPAGVEPHTHLDKALLAERATNPTGDLAGAIDANRRLYRTLNSDDIRQRAAAALGTAVRRGHTLVRSHVNVEDGIGTTAAEALLDLAGEVAEAVEVELVGLPGPPITGAAGQGNRAHLLRALELGVAAVGGAPALDDRPDEAVRWLVAAAADAGRPIDLHLDETLDERSRTLLTYAREVEARGLGGRALASHCVSLGQQPAEVVAETARILADVGVAVVALPQTNLLLQGGDRPTRVPRGTAPVRALREAGVEVIAGGDNWRDMFNPLGRIDPLETAALLAAVAQLPPAEACGCVSRRARAVLGRPAGEVREGSPAELLAVRARTVAEAVADACDERTVIHRGRVVSRTRLYQEEPAGVVTPSLAGRAVPAQT